MKKRILSLLLAGIFLSSGFLITCRVFFGLHKSIIFQQDEKMATFADSVNRIFQSNLQNQKNYDIFLELLRQNTILLLIGSGVILLGLVFLLVYAITLSLENRRAAREMKRLSERQKKLEQINLQTKQLAHHQRLEIIGTLTASISHEFNNLLTPIMGYSILTLEALPEEYGELTDNVAEIYEASRKAKMMISRLNALSRKNAEENDVRLQLDELVDKIAAEVKDAVD